MRRYEDTPGKNETVSVEFTGPRFSFSNPDNQRVDELRTVGPRTLRVIEYPIVPEWDETVADIYAKGLIAGKDLGSPSAGNRAFAVPRTVRPILHDTVAISSNPYTYDDRALFKDIGRLLRVVAETKEGSVLFIDDVSENLGVMKFSGLEDRRLFLIPGFETGLHASESVEGAKDKYEEELSRDLGARFKRVSAEFLEGFQ